MNKLIICLFAIVAFAGIVLADDLDKNFKEFLEEFGKDYSNLSKKEVHRRQKNFRDNIKMIKEHNKDPTKKFKLGVNKYTDYDPKEFAGNMCRAVRPQESQAVLSTKTFYDESVPLATSVDWSEYFQPVADQGDCGASWAFSVVALIEAYNSIQGYDVPKLSVQNVLDCDTIDGGCDYGWPTTTFRAIRDEMGNELASEEDYPYTGTRDTCKTVGNQYSSSISGNIGYSINGNITEMKMAVSRGPIVATIKVKDDGLFQNYHDGTFDCSSSLIDPNYLDHSVLLVGYNETQGSEPYWVVRNSWGPSWGYSGNVKMNARNCVPEGYPIL